MPARKSPSQRSESGPKTPEPQPSAFDRTGVSPSPPPRSEGRAEDGQRLKAVPIAPHPEAAQESRRPKLPSIDKRFRALIDHAQSAYKAAHPVLAAGKGEARRRAPTNCFKRVSKAFLNGRFRTCLMRMMDHVLEVRAEEIRKAGQHGDQRQCMALAQHQLAQVLAATYQAIDNYRSGSSLMSGAEWTWTLGTQHQYLKSFAAPRLEARAVAGYCEAMAVVRAAIRGELPSPLPNPRKEAESDSKRAKRPRDADLPRPSAVDYFLLKVALERPHSLGIRSMHASAVTDAVIPRETLGALYRVMQVDYRLELVDARINSPEQLRERLAMSLREWGVAYAATVTAVALDWLQESDYVI